jgi:hypothetical protein
MAMMSTMADGVRSIGPERKTPGRRDETPAALFGEALAAASTSNTDAENGATARAADNPEDQAADSTRMPPDMPDLPECDNSEEIASGPSTESVAGRVMALLAQAVTPQKAIPRGAGESEAAVGSVAAANSVGGLEPGPVPKAASETATVDAAEDVDTGSLAGRPTVPPTQGRHAPVAAPAHPDVPARQAIAVNTPDADETVTVETIEASTVPFDAKPPSDRTLSVEKAATQDRHLPKGTSNDADPTRTQADAARADMASVGQPHAAPVPPGPSPASASLAAQWGQAVERTTAANMRVLPVVPAGGGFGGNEAVKVMRLQLQPAGLGKVHATIRSVGSTLTVEIVAEDENAFRQLSGDAAALPAMLSTAASPVSDVSIRWQGDPQDPSRHRDFDNAPGERRPGPGHERNDDRRSGDDNANRRPGGNPGRDPSGYYV